jgi:3-hydroxyacyl-[acyl-carrier-protein] dehydratase
MRFQLIDQITAIEPGKSIRTLKNLTLGEEYLKDHFPSFPVMPGVLMLQTLVESAAWLLRITENFEHTIIVLREAKQVKYGQFMEPGRQMTVTAQVEETSVESVQFKGKGETEGRQTVSARFTLVRYNLRDRNSELKFHDDRLIEHWKNQYAMLRGDLRPT